MEQDYKERAARAERVAELLAARLAEYHGMMPALAGIQSLTARPSHTQAFYAAAAALDQWAAHQADYDTLDQAAARPPVA